MPQPPPLQTNNQHAPSLVQGLTLLHIDSHPDLQVPDLPPVLVGCAQAASPRAASFPDKPSPNIGQMFDREALAAAVDIGSFILPLAYAG